jgi:hypothetical protein
MLLAGHQSCENSIYNTTFATVGNLSVKPLGSSTQVFFINHKLINIMKPTDEEKKKILQKLEEAIDGEFPFMVLTSSSPEAAVMIAGNREDVSQMLSIAMSKIPELETIVKYARKALKHARKSGDRGSTLESELMKCETCDKKDDCHIRSLKEKVMKEGAGPEDLMKVLKHMSEKHGPIVDIKNQGDC